VQQANPDVTFVGVAARDEEDAMQAFIADLGVGAFPHVNDQPGAIWAQYGISTQPSFVFIDAEGNESRFASLGRSGLQEKIDDLF